MKRFVKWFNHDGRNGCEGVERDINIYAEINNLTIINIAPYYFWGVYVLFEEGGERDEVRIDVDQSAAV